MKGTARTIFAGKDGAGCALHAGFDLVEGEDFCGARRASGQRRQRQQRKGKNRAS
jgi:hypothetical protein